MGAILVVEDNEDLRELLVVVLRREGYEVWEAEHGAEALEVIEAHDAPPSLMLLDLMMPVMNGTELLRALRRSEPLASLPVIVLSAGGTPDMAPGANEFVRKPAGHDQLLSLVRKYCGQPA